ncbi:MAG TPA: phage tail tape measure protein, partial [Anaerolineae bacterium]|nr:phage tail tape measure protein [Anaerolineae bacterium]
MSSSVLQIIVNGQDNTSGMLNNLGTSLGNFGKHALGAGAAMTAMTAPLTLIGVKALDTAGDFEASMNVLAVSAASSATSMEDLSEAALAVGADAELVGISASQAGDAMTEMYKAGLTTNEVFGDMQGYLDGTTSLSGALRSAIDLAAASELDLAGATDAVVVAMNTFGIATEDAGTIADVLVRTADAGVASVSGLTESLKNVGPTASSMGIGIEDVTTALGLMATRGIEGAEAGTQLKSMLLNIQRPTKAVQETLQALGVSLYDASGQMLSMPEIIGQLERSMDGLTEEQRNQAITAIAGTYGLNAMNILLGEGTAGWDAMKTAVEGAATVQESAAARTQGWNATLEQLGGVIESIQITVLMPFIQETLTPLAQKFGELAAQVMELDPKILNMGVVFAALAIAAGPVLMVLGTMAMGLGALLSPIGLIVVAIGLLAAGFATGAISIDSVRPILDGVGAAFTMLQTVAQTVLANIQLFWETHGAMIMAVATTTWNTIKGAIEVVVNALAAVILLWFGMVQTFLQEHGAQIQAFLLAAWRQINTIIQLAVQLIQAVVTTVLGAVTQFISDHGASIQTILSGAWNFISNIIQTVLDLIEGIIRVGLAIIQGDW